MEQDRVYVTGHKHPDSDSIAAAIGYAFFKRANGVKAVPCRLGKLSAETRYLLERFGFEQPMLLEDARYKLGEIDKAISLLEKSHSKFPCGLTYQTLGFLYIEKGDAEKALAFNQEGLEYDDEDPVVLDNLGQVYYRLLNDKEKALPYFTKAIEIKDTQIDTLYFLASYDIENGQKDKAREKLEKALEGRFSPLNYATPEKVREKLSAL